MAATDDSGKLPGQIAGGVDVRDVGAAGVVDRHVAAAVHLHAGGVEAEALAVRHRADGEQGVAALRRPAVVAPHRHPAVDAVDADGAGALEEAHAPAEQLVLEGGRHLGVLLREHLLAGHDQRDLAPERAEHVDELHAGDARSRSPRGGSGHSRRRVGVAGREHPLAVDLGPLGEPGRLPVASSTASASTSTSPSAVSATHRVRPREAARAPEDADALAVEEPAHAVLELLLDGLDAGLERVGVDRRPRRS